MKTFFFVLTTLFSFSSLATQTVHFWCANQPAARWGTYICATGQISTDGKTIVGMTFGTCEGSQAAGEAEPVETFEFSVVQHNPALAARSNQWKQTGAFDVTTELGRAVFYYTPGSEVARVKINNDDIRLACH